VVQAQIIVKLAIFARVGKAGEGIFRRNLCERERSGNEVLDAFRREVAGRGAGDALTNEDTQANAARARFLEGFDLAQTDRGREFVAFADDDFRISGSGFARFCNDVGCELLLFVPLRD